MSTAVLRRPSGGASKKKTSTADDAGVDVGAPTAAAPVTKATNQPGAMITVVKLVLVPVLAGAAFGAVFQLSRVHEFSFIRDQLLMRRFLMLKMFLTASSFSIASLTLLPRISKTAGERIANWSKVMSETISERRGLPSLMTGAALLGAGMAVCGSCPGTVFAQVASGSVQARYILLGAAGASVVYPLIDMIPGFEALLKRGSFALQKLTLPQLLGSPTPVVAASMIGTFLTIVATLEHFSPWQTELVPLLPASEVAFGAIPPYVAGAVVGLLQVPLILVAGQHLGCSSSYMTVVAHALNLVSPRTCERVPLLAALKSNYWQVFLMVGVSIGAFVASTITGATFHSDSMITPAQGVLGGALLVSGARLAAGCTSGHGISGMGYLALNSFAAVAAMFGAGIAVANLAYRG